MNLSTFRSALRATTTDSWLGRTGLNLAGRPGLGRRRVVVARSLLRVRHFDLSGGISAQDRPAALRAQALAWQPFEDSTLRFGLKGGQGICFGWDAVQASAAAAQAGLSADDIEWVPESVLLLPPEGDGCRLVRLREGCEGQVWQQGMLLSSRWWPEPPSEVEWSNFIRLTPGAAGDSPPAVAPVPEGKRPWIELRSPDQSQDSVARLERLIVFGGGLLLVGLTVPVVHEAWSLHSAVRQAEEQVETLSAAASSVARLRTEAMQLKSSTADLVRGLRTQSPLLVMKELSEVLPKEGVVLKEFDQEGDKLKLTVELAPGLSRSALVERLQSTGVFGSIVEQRAQLQANWVAYTMRVNPVVLVPPSQASAPASDAPRKAGAT